ncbi:hypothetical protein D3C77_517740 [compost metagenome]
MTEERYQQVRKHLGTWSRDIKTLRGEQSSGPVTARAVLLLQDLDPEIRKRTEGRRTLDDVTRGLMRLDIASTEDFIAISENVMGGASKVLDTRLLR